MLKHLKKILGPEKKDKRLFDIIVYGSTVKGAEEPRDLDILAIFLNGTLRERLDKIQELKFKLEKTVKDTVVDIKQILLKELFSPYFLAKRGILLEGVSVFHGKKFCETLGFKPYAMFFYSLNGLTHAQKVKFNYLLAGRNTKGIIEEFGGERPVSGAVKIPIENSIVFEEILKHNKVPFSRKNMLEEI